MKQYNIHRNKSIGSRIRYTFLIFIMFGSIIFTFLIYLQNNVFNEYEEYMSVNTKLSQISVEFSNSYNFYDSYMNTRDERYIQKYKNSNNNINKQIDEIKSFVDKDEDSSVYLRTLSNMINDYEIISNDAMCETKSNEKSYDRLILLKNMSKYINIQSNQLTVAYLKYSNNEYSHALKIYKNVEEKMYFIIIFIIMLSFILAIIISKNLILVTEKLCKYAEALSNGQWDIPDIENQKYDEFNKLANAFNKMKKSIRQFIKELNEKSQLENNYNKEKLKNIETDKLLKETQLKALQSQINPHFLFNILNTISRMAMFENANETIKLIEATSKILRYNLSYKDRFVELNTELDMIKSYVFIQQTRFQDQMSFNFKIGDNLSDIKLPSMIIQPIVENAIIHGLQEKYNGGIINISVDKEKDFCIINVQDNGKGISKENIHKIFNHEEISGKKTSSSGIGIYNVKRRLELYFNRQDLIKINSIVGQGSLVTIRIPIKDGD